jgi:heptosyltransferase-1
VQTGFEDLLNTHPSLDAVITWDKNAWKALWQQRRLGLLLREIMAMRKQLTGYQFDQVIDIQGLLKSAFFALLSGARTRIGLGSKEGSQWLMNKVIAKIPDASRIGSEYLQLAQSLNLPCDDFPMHIEITEDDYLFADKIINKESIRDNYVIFCPFTTRPQKHWAAEHWRQLADLIQQNYGYRALVLGGPQDQSKAHDLCQHTQLLSLAGTTRLRQAYALISRAKFAVGVDTGLTHMAIAANIPTLALFGSTRPYLDTPGYQTKIIYKHLPCSPCRRNPSCHGRFDCMTSITAHEVMQAIKMELMKLK